MKRSRVNTATLFPRMALYFIPPFIVTTLMWVTSENDITVVQGLCALALLLFPWAAYLKWRKDKQVAVPLLSMITCMYWIYYGLPLFWGDRVIQEIGMGERTISSEYITQALIMVMVGIFCLWLGMKTKIGERLRPQRFPQLPSSQRRWNYLRLVFIIGILFNLYDPSPYLLGEGGRQLILMIQFVVPTLTFAIFFRQYLRGEDGKYDKLFIAAYCGARLFVAMSTGWLGTFLSVIIVCAAIYISERRKIPVLIVAVAIVAILFLQVGKEEFRKTYWYASDVQTGRIERIGFWFNASIDKWESAFTGKSDISPKELFYPSISRLALLTQSANVIEDTPSVVDFQYGRLYTYLFISPIPRFIWPDKPSMNEANQFYQTAYNITSEERLEAVSISIGSLTERYINFGWFGVVGVMFLLGVFFNFFQSAFLAKSSGILMNGIGFILLPQFLALESQLAVYLSGIIQQIFLILLILLPIVQFRKSPKALKLKRVPYTAQSHPVDIKTL